MRLCGALHVLLSYILYCELIYPQSFISLVPYHRAETKEKEVDGSGREMFLDTMC